MDTFRTGIEYSFERMEKLKIDFGIGLSNISLFENLNSINNTLYGSNNNSNSINFIKVSVFTII